MPDARRRWTTSHGCSPVWLNCTPTGSVVIGEGGSGGALALGVADRVLMLQHAIYSVISPEGAAAILFRDAARAQQVAEALKITADDLLRLGVIDGIVTEPEGGAHVDADLAARRLGDALDATLRDLAGTGITALLRHRYEKYRHIGKVGVYWRQVVRREMQELLDKLEQHLPRHEPEATRQAKDDARRRRKDLTTPST